MNRSTLPLIALALPVLAFAHDWGGIPQARPKAFPDSDFILDGNHAKAQKSGLVLGPMQNDGKGGTKGSFAVYGGRVEVSSLSFSADGKVLAVGSTPGLVDVWDVESKRKILSLKGGTAVGLNSEGNILAIDGDGIEIYEVASGDLKRKIPRKAKRPDDVITGLTFNSGGALLLVTAQGDDDTVFDLSSGRLVTTLANTQHSQFSKDGSLLIGGDAKHLILWDTKDWSKVRDLPNGPDYVRTIAAYPEGNLVVIGGPNDARLLHLDSGQELAKIGTGWANFTSFNQSGTLIFTYVGDNFAVWDTRGNQLCSRRRMANGTVALSPDGHWLATASIKGGPTVAIWDMQKALTACSL